MRRPRTSPPGEPVGFILSGGPASVYEPDAPFIAEHILTAGLPILGICYGMQALAHQLGGHVANSRVREYGRAQVAITESHDLWAGLPAEIDAWMSHGDRVESMPPGFSVIARNESSPAAAMAGTESSDSSSIRRLCTPHWASSLSPTSLFKVCGCTGDWTPHALAEAAESLVRERVGTGRRDLCPVRRRRFRGRRDGCPAGFGGPADMCIRR